MKSARPEAPRLILFGAFDRHNFGDLLLAHCAAAGEAREPVFAGLAARDLRANGGHHVIPISEAIARHGAEPAELVIVGGEILTTTAWEAAVMLQTPADAAQAIRLHDRNETARNDWARRTLQDPHPLPYVLNKDDLPTGWTVEFRAVGGVRFEALSPAARREAVRALAAADRVTVRDVVTQAALSRHGVRARLARDPASESARLFGPQLPERIQLEKLAASGRPFLRWIAVQTASQWGDDATLARIASRVASVAQREDCSVVLFCAGTAPWHDDLETLVRLAQHLRSQAADVPVAVFKSTRVFDICALLAGAYRYVGTSLHGWIVANSFGVPSSCLVAHKGDKAAAYLDTWHPQPRAWETLDDPIAPL
ncbi:MAG TPA: polysaccharide pyruvyl transferase family protein [Aromatoleum sp.]|uniref:polysaccharide pyruvyl transferase family protein n=1 Tax=Aromatoleum sp. TaxID=2307007 RepID=UPI002B47F40E|nr:polysaccharide pyruvyl transferase family protein [Aromatoleum sp.]HJV24261.1 polysaccharide pyruvyl transferase family protein [Aromatoleum sp.]